RCDSIGLDGKPVNGPRGSWSHAQKMRASMTYVFGRIYGIGSQHWQRVTLSDGNVRLEGNPSISDRVATYMLDLHRRKVRGGETATSARAITPAIMERLYDFNHIPEYWEIRENHPDKSPDDIHRWGGPMVR
ncbi:hypothetical protein GALMADRAFT_49901, partial [Galerina marginata CBS 339.88]